MPWVPLLHPALQAAPTAGRTQVTSPANIYAHLHMAELTSAGTPGACRMRWLLCIRTGLNGPALVVCVLKRRVAFLWLGLCSVDVLKNTPWHLSAGGLYNIIATTDVSCLRRADYAGRSHCHADSSDPL